MSTTVLAYLLLLLTLVSYYFAKRLYQQFPYLLLSPAFLYQSYWSLEWFIFIFLMQPTCRRVTGWYGC